MKLYSTVQAAKILGLTSCRVQQFCKNGRLGTKVGRNYVIPADELKRFSKRDRPPGRPVVKH